MSTHAVETPAVHSDRSVEVMVVDRFFVEVGRIALQEGLLFCVILNAHRVKRLVKRDVFRMALLNIAALLNSLALFYSVSPMRCILFKSSFDCLGLFFTALQLLLQLAFGGLLLFLLVQKPRQPTQCSELSTLRVFTLKSSLCFAYPSEDQYTFQYLTPCLPATS